jgi:hypothetical protein
MNKHLWNALAMGLLGAVQPACSSQTGEPTGDRVGKTSQADSCGCTPTMLPNGCLSCFMGGYENDCQIFVQNTGKDEIGKCTYSAYCQGECFPPPPPPPPPPECDPSFETCS